MSSVSQSFLLVDGQMVDHRYSGLRTYKIGLAGMNVEGPLNPKHKETHSQIFTVNSFFCLYTVNLMNTIYKENLDSLPYEIFFIYRIPYLNIARYTCIILFYELQELTIFYGRYSEYYARRKVVSYWQRNGH